MMARAALRSRWWTASVRVWTGATTIESPVWTPSGSTFSIEHTAMHVSSASRMTSYSISCQPTRQRSTITWPIGLARSPARTRSRYAASVSTMPPPVPPSVKAGRTMAGRPISRERATLARPRRRPSTIQRRRVRLADPVEQVAERLAVLGHLDRLERRPEQADRVALEDAGLGQGVARFSAVWPPRPASRPSGSLLGDDRLDRLDGQRLEVDRVGDLRVGHDRGRVRVDEDRADALGPQRAAGLRPGVVELGGLADDDRPGAEDQDRGGLAGRSAHRALVRPASRPPRTGRTRRARRAGPGAPSGWYWTVSIGSSRWRRPSTEPVVEVDLADPEPGRGRQRLADDLDLVVLGGHLDEPQLDVLDRVVGAVVAEPQPARVGAGGPADDLVAEADPQQRPPVVDDGAGPARPAPRAGPGRPDRATG